MLGFECNGCEGWHLRISLAEAEALVNDVELLSGGGGCDWWLGERLAHALFFSRIGFQVEVAGQAVEVLGMNAEQTCGFGVTAFCVMQCVEDHLFF